MRDAGPVRYEFGSGAAHATVCAPPGATTRSGESQPLNAIAAVAEADRAGAGRCGGADAALEDADFDFGGLTDADEFDVGLVREIGMRADFCADGLPGFAGDGEVRVVDDDDEMGIAGGDGDAGDGAAVGESDGLLRGAVGMPMPVVTSTVVLAVIVLNGVDAADAQAGVGFDCSSSPGWALIASAIHAATQRVPLPLISAMEPSALWRRMRPDFAPDQAKNSMPSAPMPVLRAQRRRVRSAQIVSCGGFFSDDEEIVAAGVGLGEGNQSSSGSRKLRSLSMAGSAMSFPRRRSCAFFVAVMVKLMRCRSPIASAAKFGETFVWPCPLRRGLTAASAV